MHERYEPDIWGLNSEFKDTFSLFTCPITQLRPNI